MTSNQRRAMKLADDIRRFGLAAGDVNDADWTLLLLAAGQNNCRALPQNVALRVLDQASRSVGYFAPLTEEEELCGSITNVTWPDQPAFASAI
jgi:hypothetical protein